MGKKLLKFLLIGVLAAVAIATYLYFNVLSPVMIPNDRDEPIFLHIPTGSSYDQVLDSLHAEDLLEDATTFTLLAERMNYRREEMRPGRYALQPGWTMVDVIRHLRGGGQAPVRVVLNNEREPMNVAAKVAQVLEGDSLDFVQLFHDREYVQSIDFRAETLISLFIPNTYELYWNTSPEAFIERMLQEHQRFWDQNDRLAKAERWDLTPAEVYTLASIIEKETQQSDEKRRMAGVYLNRLQTGMLLQADPTAVFARRDFHTARVTYYHTKFDSPYNTYMHPGLPPGPIAMASITSIDAVLNAEDHDYIFFCARGDGTGYHNFAETMSGHSRNIAIYKNNLRSRGLR